MSRSNDNNKRVLRTGNGRPRDTSYRNMRRKNDNYSIKNRHQMSKTRNNYRTRKQRKTSGFLILTMIIALLAFVIGAGIGVSLSLDDGSDNGDDGASFQNVTYEMMNGANTTTTKVSYDKSVDGADYNNKTVTKNSTKTTKNKKSG